MSFSVIYQFLMEERQTVYHELFFERLSNHLITMNLTQRHLWMHKFVQALSQHCHEVSVAYCVSTRSVDHFVKILDRLLTYADVNLSYLDMCYGHVCGRCLCRTAKRPVSEPTAKWVFIPKAAKRNETQIPIPYDILEKSNLTEHFKLIRIHFNGVLMNETLYPIQEGEHRQEPVSAIVYGCIFLLVLICGWLIVLFKHMQKQQHLRSNKDGKAAYDP